MTKHKEQSTKYTKILGKPLRYKYSKKFSVAEQKLMLKRILLLSLARLQSAGINGKGIPFPVVATFSRMPDMQAYHLLKELEREGFVRSYRKGRFLAFKLRRKYERILRELK
jgi:hypothetical protein